LRQRGGARRPRGRVPLRIARRLLVQGQDEARTGMGDHRAEYVGAPKRRPHRALIRYHRRVPEPKLRGVVSIASTVLQVRASGSETIPAANADTAPPPAASRPGQRYAIVDVLGEGGMGRVDRVHDHDLLRDVAAKRLLPELRGDKGLVDQFLWEARVTAYLDHPNIVPV